MNEVATASSLRPTNELYCLEKESNLLNIWTQVNVGLLEKKKKEKKTIATQGKSRSKTIIPNHNYTKIP